MLEIAALSHTYPDGHIAIRGMDLTVPDGELVSIVGPSGCGKSTLLRCIAGLIRPTGGKVVLNDEQVAGVPDGLAVVFQDYSRSLFPWLTVRDNVALPLRRRGKSKTERRDAAMRALESVGLADAARKYPWQLSGGMQQRVSIARALAYQPSLLLMDEPFGSVDAQTREDLEDLVLQVHRAEKMTILLVTHDIDESVYVGDRVVVLGPSPTGVVADVPVPLPAERDQIETRAMPEFISTRAKVGRLVRGDHGALGETDVTAADSAKAETDTADETRIDINKTDTKTDKADVAAARKDG
ncbi:ABC transporter ATP-binding protein [Actinomadura miaoliensis]|uniref:ABC transporter ATP-binding protein n=1 Tax=Actinomadura miaoliensis TaxID=430685 RepID=A0ABP7WUD8_9ACTN